MNFNILFSLLPKLFSFSTFLNPIALCCSASCCTESKKGKKGWRQECLEINEPRFPKLHSHKCSLFHLLLFLFNHIDSRWFWIIICICPQENPRPTDHWKSSRKHKQTFVLGKNEKLLNFPFFSLVFFCYRILKVKIKTQGGPTKFFILERLLPINKALHISNVRYQSRID